MSFAVSVQAMITSLKNNARQRNTLYDKKSVFQLRSRKNIACKPERKATPEQLRAIKERLQRYNRTVFIRSSLAFAALLLLLCMGAWLCWPYLMEFAGF